MDLHPRCRAAGPLCRVDIRRQALGRPTLELADSVYPLIGEWGRTNRSPSLSIGHRRLRVVASESVVLLQLSLLAVSPCTFAPVLSSLAISVLSPSAFMITIVCSST